MVLELVGAEDLETAGDLLGVQALLLAPEVSRGRRDRGQQEGRKTAKIVSKGARCGLGRASARANKVGRAGLPQPIAAAQSDKAQASSQSASTASGAGPVLAGPETLHPVP